MRDRFIGFFKKNGLFLLLFAVMAGFYYDGVLEKGPLNTHMWRQTDCISITHHYATGSPFLEPEMHIQLADKNTSGKTAGEFPILYYGVGKLWHWFGKSYFTYRLVWLIILFFGAFAFFSACRRLLKDQIWALLLTGLLLCSPTFIIYGVSFLTDVPAFCFVLIALYFILRYQQESKNRFFWWAMGFFALAGLIKISSLIAFVFLGFVLLLETLGVKTLNGETLFRRNWKEWLGFAAVLIAIFSWYIYAASYNEQHRLKYTFNDIYPIWEPEKGGLSVLWERVRTYSSYIFLNRAMWWLLAVCLLTVIVMKRKMALFAWLSTIIITLGVLAYIALWGPLLGVHDYYYSALLILIPGILLPAVHLLQKRFPKAASGVWVKSIAGLLFIYSFWYCLDITHIKFDRKSREFDVVGNKDLMGELSWINWDVEANLYRFSNMRAYLKEIGVKDSDRLIILPDGSFNVTLVLSGHKGWTDFEHYNDPGQIRELVRKKAKYLLIGDPELKKAIHLQPFFTDSVGTFERVEIYQLHRNQ